MGLADFAVTKNRDHERFPGPGQYNPKLDPGRTTTLRGRYESRPTLLTGTTGDIGPGKYEVPSTIGTAPGGRITATRRKDTVATETNLGPKYDVRNYDMAASPGSPRFSFGVKTTPRERADDGGAPIPHPPSRDSSPDLTPRHKRKGFSFGIRPTNDGPTAPKGLGPGPGAYSVKRFGDDVKKPRPPHQPHVDHAQTPRAAAPGPGQYDYDIGTVSATARPKYVGHKTHGTMGGRNFPPEPKTSDIGPGAYEDPDTIASRAAHKKGGVTILGRFTEYTDMDEIYPRPAPGDYTIPSTMGGKGFSFGARHAPPKATLDVPGPGYVNPDQYSMARVVEKGAKGIYFNVVERGSKDDRQGHRRTFEDGVPKTTPRKSEAESTKKKSTRERTALPRVEPPSKKPGFTMSGRYKQPEPDSTGPGPGSYDSYKYDDSSSKGTVFYKHPYNTR
uniref:Uncharacterized protein n=1 Tax=Neobodo designis TaxID=312471 RepID=A0A7S1M1L1_NEODS|mmetsp:Transcript_32370/g.100148  ORF Transcript_32370/g.100148 Transcript_32370/m.100148 type:complete len:446 (+) Transcript_32370:37-1374(+)